jgi:uncharacterized repeat protein (TIGR01451 family)
MHGQLAGLIAAGLLTAGIALAGECPAAEAPADRAPQPVLDVRQRLPEWVARGEAVPIEIVITNAGSTVAESIRVASTLRASVDLIEAAPTPERLRDSLCWTLGSLAPGQQHILRLRVQPRAGVRLTEVRSSVQVTFQTSVMSSSATQVRRPELELEATGPETARIGEPVAFQLVVRNKGNTPAHAVLLETLLPAGLSHPGGNDLENEVGNLEPGEVRRIVLRVTPTQAGDLRQRIRAQAAGEEAVEREVRLHVQDLKLALAANGPRVLYEGWPASFELTVRNEGADVVRQVRLTAVLPAGIAFVRADAGAVYAPETHGLSWDLGELRSGEARTVLWSGNARGSGEQTCQAILTAGAIPCKRVAWQTSVVRAPPGPSPAPDAGPDLGAPPPPLPPSLAAGPRPAGAAPQGTAPPATPTGATMGGGDPAPAPGSAEPARPPPGHSSTWRPPPEPRPQGQPPAGAPAASP